MSDEFNVNEYWLKRAREYPAEERRYAEYHRLQEYFLFEKLRQGQVPMRNIIELGCGAGRVTRLLAENYPGVRITALDLSPDMIALAKSRCADYPGVRFEQYDFYSNAPLPGSVSTAGTKDCVALPGSFGLRANFFSLSARNRFS